MMHPPRHFSKVADGQHSICHTLQYLQWREKYNTLNTGASHGVAWVWLCLQPFVFLSQFHIEFRLLVWGKKSHLFFPLEESITIAIDLPFFTFSSSCRDIFTRPCFFFWIFQDPINFVPSICTVHNRYQNKCFFNITVFIIRFSSQVFLFTFPVPGFVAFPWLYMFGWELLFLFPLLEK